LSPSSPPPLRLAAIEEEEEDEEVSVELTAADDVGEPAVGEEDGEGSCGGGRLI
jgi:hypothetical protein